MLGQAIANRCILRCLAEVIDGWWAVQDPKDIPEAEGQQISSSRQPGGIWAAQPFSGIADSQRSRHEALQLQAALHRNGIKPASDVWALARYNDPSTKPWFRRNEVLMPVDKFDLWNT